jgi:hypothetical protein
MNVHESPGVYLVRLVAKTNAVTGVTTPIEATPDSYCILEWPEKRILFGPTTEEACIAWCEQRGFK